MLIISLVLLLLSVILHELSHGYVARSLGDPTAENMGRLTLNPIAHLDLVGSIILPLIGLLSPAHIFFGWAKPVPVNPMYFKDPQRDYFKVAIAGPAVNFLIAGVVSFSLFALQGLGLLSGILQSPLFHFQLSVWEAFGIINLVLGVFNMIPIPPLDGSKIFYIFAPNEAYKLEAMGPILLLVFILFFGGIFQGIISFFLNIFFPFVI